MRFLGRLFISIDEVVYSHVHDIAIYCTDEVIVLFGGKGVSGCIFFLQVVGFVLVLNVLKTFQNRFELFSFVEFFLLRVFKSCHSSRHC